MDSIYKNDKLNRERFCKSVVNVIDKNINNDNGLFLSINGGYGSGKTTTMRFIEDELKFKDNYIVVNYNTWLNNIYNDPLMPILYNIVQSLKEKCSKDKLEAVKNSAKNIFIFLAKFGKNIFQNKTGIEIPKIEEKENFFNEMIAFEEAIKNFKDLIVKIIGTDKKIILLVDEIDRCLPDYSIQILEKIHHLFNIKGFATIIAVDKKQLEKTIEIIFGQNTNICGYLARFIDYEFDLPNNNDHMILEEKFESWYACKILINILNSFNVNLREKIKICDEYILIASNYISYDNVLEAMFIMFLLCLKKKEWDNYNLLKTLNKYQYGSQVKYEDTVSFKAIKIIKEKKFLEKNNITENQFLEYILCCYCEEQFIAKEDKIKIFEDENFFNIFSGLGSVKKISDITNKIDLVIPTEQLDVGRGLI